ncbi:MAG: FtsX-like permease family protein, partial [Bacteroidetes bacterium]|nr:FtsX-like permease family protein [Bacteroidota bacterium]
ISHSTLERKKEFNIRRVLGAGISQILMLIYREFVLLISLASLIAIPAAWFFVNNWLLDFAYRIDTVDYWYLFLLGSIAALLIAVITMSFRAIGAAMGNPAEGLRYE